MGVVFVKKQFKEKNQTEKKKKNTVSFEVSGNIL